MDTCIAPGCDRPIKNRLRGWCTGHARRWEKHGSVLADVPLKRYHPGEPCSVEGCDRPQVRRLMCDMHSQRRRGLGPQAAPMRLRNATMDQRLRHYSMPLVESGCWVWTGTTIHSGYGLVQDPEQGKQRLAHRVAYETWVGPIPEGLNILHSRQCISRSCINPAHLRPGTQTENMADRKALHGY